MTGRETTRVVGGAWIDSDGSRRPGVRACWPRRATGWLFAVTAAVAVCGGAACSGGSRGPGGGAPPDAGSGGAPIPQDQFCAEYSGAVCDRVERCSCSAELVSACRSRFRDECAAQLLDREVQARLSSGAIRYDAAAAGRLVARIRGLTGCGTLEGELGWTLADVRSAGGVFTGTKGAGESCEPVRRGVLNLTECFASPCTDVETEGVFVCLGPQTVGSPCSASCFRTDVAIGEPATFFQRVALRCSPETGRCQARVPLGSPCSRAIECDSTHCDAESGRCEPALADGQACSSPLECASANCDESAAGSTCTPRRTDGSECFGDTECASGVCMMRQCVRGACRDVQAVIPE